MLAATVRTGLVIVGALTLFGGLLTMVGVDMFGGLWIAATGFFLLAAGFLEHRRYRSASTEGSAAAAGPGGGETLDDQLERRFRPTPEVFVDPSSGHRMRVLVDPATGERRYRAES